MPFVFRNIQFKNHEMSRLKVLSMVVLLTCGLLSGCTDTRQKSEWAFLQNIEHQQKNTPISGIKFHSEGEYRAVGIRSEQMGLNVWILLNPQSPPFYKQLPHGQFTLTQDEFLKIANSGAVDETVLACCASHVLNNSSKQ